MNYPNNSLQNSKMGDHEKRYEKIEFLGEGQVSPFEFQTYVCNTYMRTFGSKIYNKLPTLYVKLQTCDQLP